MGPLPKNGTKSVLSGQKNLMLKKKRQFHLKRDTRSSYSKPKISMNTMLPRNSLLSCLRKRFTIGIQSLCPSYSLLAVLRTLPRVLVICSDVNNTPRRYAHKYRSASTIRALCMFYYRTHVYACACVKRQRQRRADREKATNDCIRSSINRHVCHNGSRVIDPGGINPEQFAYRRRVTAAIRL